MSLTPRRAAPYTRPAEWTVSTKSNERILLIEDVGHMKGHPTITNDAENVVTTLHEHGELANARRLLYLDSEGVPGELLHDDKGGFITYSYPDDLIPWLRDLGVQV